MGVTLGSGLGVQGRRKPRPETRNPEPKTRHPTCGTRIPKPGTQTPEANTRNPTRREDAAGQSDRGGGATPLPLLFWLRLRRDVAIPTLLLLFYYSRA